MNSYELMIKINHALIKGDKPSNDHINKIVERLLSDSVINKKQVGRCTRVGFSSNYDKGTSGIYPVFYIPPYNNGKKLETILGQTPKTQILSANMYELEILRLLYIFAPENNDVKKMISMTLERLKNTCFGYMDDGKGECFDASLVVLRFLASAARNENQWIKSRIDNFNRHYGDKKRPWYSLYYYWLCLSELPSDISKSETEKYKDEILDRLINRRLPYNGENDRLINPVIICILRNVISKYPEYYYIRKRQPYLNDRDGRLCFDMSI